MLKDELDLWYLLSDCVDELRDVVILSHSERQVSEFMALTARQVRLLGDGGLQRKLQPLRLGRRPKEIVCGKRRAEVCL